MTFDDDGSEQSSARWGIAAAVVCIRRAGLALSRMSDVEISAGAKK
jgi:hypothetical protein